MSVSVHFPWEGLYLQSGYIDLLAKPWSSNYTKKTKKVNTYLQLVNSMIDLFQSPEHFIERFMVNPK